VPENDEETRLSLRNEYTVVGADWRFLVGLRFATLAFAATLLSALLGAYQYVLTNKAVLGELGMTALWAIPGFGLIITVALYLLEQRTKQLYTACLLRGKHIEEKWNIINGHFSTLINTPPPYRIVSHTWAIRIIYGLIFLTWFYLGFLREIKFPGF